jgi:hypothetical protein
MKFGIEYPVLSLTTILGIIEVSLDNKIYIFSPNDDGFISKILIIANAKNPDKFRSYLGPVPGDDTADHLITDLDEDLKEDIIKEFQELEALLSFKFNFKRVIWELSFLRWIYETQDELKDNNVFTFQRQLGHLDIPTNATHEQLEELIKTKSRYTRLAVFMSFYREGINEYHSLKYINAFYNFYFVLEGLYGNKKWRNVEIENEFKQSNEFRTALTEVINNNIVSSTERHQEILALLTSKRRSLDVDGMAHLIVQMRGALHHFSDDPTKIQGTPFSQERFGTMALILMELAEKLISQKMKNIDAGTF